MPFWLNVFLVILFLIHWIAFTRLAMLRSLVYFWLLSLLFFLLTMSFSLRLLYPNIEVAGQPLHLLLRYGAWALTGVTIPILIVRLRQRLTK
jgi:hypothetical protein